MFVQLGQQLISVISMSLYVKGFGAAAVQKSAARKNFADY